MLQFLYMELENRKEHIIRCIKLGMDLTSSMYCAECTESEIELLKNDKEFEMQVLTYQSLEELSLLEDFDTAVEIQKSKGNTSGIQWKLAHMNKKRWGNEVATDKGNGLPGGSVTIVLPDNGRSK